jgi:hypothetical protein
MEFKKKQGKFNKLVFLSLISIFLFAIIVKALGTQPDVNQPQTMVLFMNFSNDSVAGENYQPEDGEVFTINDYSDSGNNGTTSNITYNASGGFLGDGAFEFNRVSNINIVSDPTNLSENITISTWFNVYENSSGRETILGITNNNFRLIIEFNPTTSGGAVIGSVYNGSAYIGNSQSNMFNNVFNKWNNLVLTWDGQTQTSNTYLNGKKLSGGLTPSSSSVVGIKIGSDTNGGNIFNGSIDDVIIYNSILSSQEVLNIYNDYVGCSPNLGYIDCSQNCTLNDDYYIDGNLTISPSADAGIVTLNGNFTFNGTDAGQYLIQSSGCTLDQTSGSNII